MASVKPTIIPKGASVLWQQGGTKRTFRTQSVDEALELAAKLEQQWADEVAGRSRSYALLEERGVDIVRHHPDETEPEPEPEPEEPEPDVEEEADAEVSIDIQTDWDPDSERVALIVDTTHNITLWRSIGGRSSTFEVSAADPLTRSFKAVEGDVIEIRVAGPDGELLHSGTFG